MMFNINLVQKWHIDEDINSSVDPTKWTLKLETGGSQDSSLTSRPSGQKRESWVFLELELLVSRQIAKRANNLLDNYKKVLWDWLAKSFY
jgi:hypothetical protein